MDMQQQIVELTKLLKDHFTQTTIQQSPTIIPETQPTQNTVKRSRSEEEIEHAPKRTASSGEEVKSSATHNLQSEVMMETPSLEEDVGGNGRSNKPLTLSKASSSSPDQQVKESVRSGSSRPSVDRGSAVSNKKNAKPKPIVAPNRPFR